MLVFFSISLSAQETINTMFYNLLEFPNAAPGGRSDILKNIIVEFQPDIFMVCELQNEVGADLVLNTSLNSENASYSRAEFVYNQSSGSDLQQLLFYKTNKFSLESEEIITTPIRDINKYVLKLNTVDQEEDPIYIYVYVAHLKSSQGTDNKQLRLEMVTEFTNDIENIASNSFVIFSGDFNLYTSTEPAYQKLLDPNNAIQMIDPINTLGSWHNNEDFQEIHSQSTRISSGGFGAGAGGGLDDRFDFITISETMVSNPKLHYITDSYKSFGNNGNCYNIDINDESCIGTFSQELRDDLYNMSDHLPIIMQLETNKEFILGGLNIQVSEIISIEKTLVDDYLAITISEEYSENITFSIYNSLGQLILKFNPEGNKINQIDVSFLQSGLFYIKTSNSNSTVYKFLKR